MQVPGCYREGFQGRALTDQICRVLSLKNSIEELVFILVNSFFMVLKKEEKCKRRFMVVVNFTCLTNM